MPKTIGYARVSRVDQNPELQTDALKAANCDQIFIDRGQSGAKRNRPELEAALETLRPGDKLVVWKLDRLARSLAHLIKLIGSFQERGIHFESLTEKIDTSSAYGEFIFHIMGALAQMERRLISERTKAGLETARRRGVKLGRERSLDNAQLIQLDTLYREKEMNVPELAKYFSVSESTIYRYNSIINSCSNKFYLASIQSCACFA